MINLIPKWLLYALGAVVAIITYENIFKKIVGTEGEEQDKHPTSYAAAIFITVGIYCTVLYLFTGIQSTDFTNLFIPSFFLLLIVNIVLYTLAPFFYYPAFKKLPLSEITILYSLTGVYALIIGLLVGTEHFVFSHLVGGALILISIIALSLKEGKWDFSKSFVLMITATFFYAIASITDDLLISNNYFNILFLEAIAFGIPGILLLGIDKGARNNFRAMLKKDTYPSIALNAVLYLISFFAILSAYKNGGSASQVNFIMSTETILVVITAAIFLKERQHLLKKFILALVVIIGIYLLR